MLYRGRSYVKYFYYSERDAKILQNLQRGVEDAIRMFQASATVSRFPPSPTPVTAGVLTAADFLSSLNARSPSSRQWRRSRRGSR